MSSRKKISILGVTGSVGQSTVDIILSKPEMFEVCTLTAYENFEKLAGIAKNLNAKTVVIGNEEYEDSLRLALKESGIAVLSGKAALEKAVGPGTDITVAAITGIAGLRPLMGAIKNSRSVAIANKEPLVAAGHLVLAEAKKYNTQILPIDSEHNAIFQVFNFEQRAGIERIILTASGGPFRTWSADEIAHATPEQAVAHPNWDMGAKISVDSATLMNKALEVIEAHVLFAMPADRIDVLVHPESVVHSMVEYNDGSVLAQMGASDMKTPIAYALGWPDRIKTPGERLDFSSVLQLNFEQPNVEKFPALTLAYKCLELGPEACLTLNAANEVAVNAFLNKEIDFPAILEAISFALGHVPDISLQDIDSVEESDEAVRQITKSYLNQRQLHSKSDRKAV